MKKACTPGMYLLFAALTSCSIELAVGLVSSTTTSKNPPATPLATKSKPIVQVEIEYDAIGEYIEVVYEHKDYFGGDLVLEDIYNARDGLVDGGPKATLDSDGFELATMPTESVKDWEDPNQIVEHYIPLLRSQLEDRIEDLDEVIFWHPMYRGETMDISPNSAPPASSVHLDTDFAAFELEELVNLMSERAIGLRDNPADRIRDALLSQNRFMVVNAWRNINEEPVLRAPLGLFLPHYSGGNTTSDVDDDDRLCYPWARPDLNQSHWYVFPRLTKDEVILFKQYDRRKDKVSDLWHCALPIMEEDGEDASPRRSLDIRAFCILKESVPNHMDRLGPIRDAEEAKLVSGRPRILRLLSRLIFLDTMKSILRRLREKLC